MIVPECCASAAFACADRSGLAGACVRTRARFAPMTITVNATPTIAPRVVAFRIMEDVTCLS
jgi:hypothetical protein